MVNEYGEGFSTKNIRHMIQFSGAFPDEPIVSTLWIQLGWSHFKEIIYIKEIIKRDFYAEMCRIERWSVRTLREKIDGMLYERTAISRKPETVIRHELDTLRADDQITPDLNGTYLRTSIFRSPSFPRVFGGNLLDKIRDPRQKPSGMTENNR